MGDQGEEPVHLIAASNDFQIESKRLTLISLIDETLGHEKVVVATFEDVGLKHLTYYLSLKEKGRMIAASLLQTEVTA